MKTALVAGGAGFIGSHLCEYLLERDYKVFALDNLVTGSRSNIEHLFDLPNFNWIEYDISNPIFMNSKCDEIYNLASPASPIDFERIPIEILKTTGFGQYNLLNWAKSHNARILFTSTSEVYGDPLVHPQTEEYLGNVDCTGTRGCYDEAKRFGEAMSMAFARKHGVQTRIVRIFNTYGPRMRLEDGRVIPNFFRQALKREPFTIYGDGSQTRSLCFVDDLVEVIYRTMQSDYSRPINIGNPQEMTILEIAQAVAKACQVPFKAEHKPLPASDPKQRRPDITKAREILGWSPQVSLEEGFSRTLAYFKSIL